jgi:hypothetical protein
MVKAATGGNRRITPGFVEAGLCALRGNKKRGWNRFQPRS